MSQDFLTIKIHDHYKELLHIALHHLRLIRIQMNSSGPKLKKKLTFDVGLRTPAFLLDDSEPSAVFKHAIDSPQEPSFRRCK